MKEYITPTINTVITLIAMTVMYNHVSNVEQHVSERIDATIISLMPKVDTAKRVIAPKLHSISNNYFYVKGITLNKSTKLINHFEYDPMWPTEIWEGYITPVKLNSGAKYYIWTSIEMKKNMEISVWVLADDRDLEIGYHSNNKEKEYTQMLFPIAPIKKPSTVTF